MVRMRTIRQCVAELRTIDPNTAITASALRRWVREGEINVVQVGNKQLVSLEAVELFKQQHPDIKVKCSYSEWSGYEARSRIRMISDTEADVMQINIGWLGQFSADGTGYYDLSKVSDYVDLSSFPDEILSYGTRNGILLGIRTGGSCRIRCGRISVSR